MKTAERNAQICQRNRNCRELCRVVLAGVAPKDRRFSPPVSGLLLHAMRAITLAADTPPFLLLLATISLVILLSDTRKDAILSSGHVDATFRAK
eukprot:3606160-Pleurochrysis_carterae.AAC.2